jgi:hypothetical protein
LSGLAVGVPVGLILAVGIIIIFLWKCFALKKERLEYIKFKKEQEMSIWGAVSAFILISHMQEDREKETYIDTHTHTIAGLLTHQPMLSPLSHCHLSHSLTFSLSLSFFLSFFLDTGIKLYKIL